MKNAPVIVFFLMLSLVIYFVLFTDQFSSKYNKYFDSEEVEVNDFIEKGERYLLVKIINGKGIIEGVTVKNRSGNLAKEILFDLGDTSSYDYVRILFEEGGEKVYALVEKDTVEAASIWYDFDVKRDLNFD